MNPIADPSDTLNAPRLWRVLAAGWFVYWLLSFWIGIQEYWRSGGQHLWEPLLDYGTAALLATAVLLLQVQRSRRFTSLLGQPLRWFVAMSRWAPLLAPAFVVTMYAMRHAVRALVGHPYRHGPWGEVMVYETVKFLLSFASLTAVQFGVHSYRHWTRERLRAEQQARLANEAQLAQLTQQLQPHFLFNALNTVSSLIHTDPDLADALLTRLASLLRAATDAGQRPQHPLADELALLESYAAIMVQRFGERASVTWSIAAETHACPVPTLSLQPLLENCFRHVVEQRRRPTHIVIRARCTGDRLVVEIEDDGDLRDATLLVPRIGLGNLQRRLLALHGEQAGLGLSARAEGGLVVRLELPCAC